MSNLLSVVRLKSTFGSFVASLHHVNRAKCLKGHTHCHLSTHAYIHRHTLDFVETGAIFSTYVLNDKSNMFTVEVLENVGENRRTKLKITYNSTTQRLTFQLVACIYLVKLHLKPISLHIS